MEIQEIENITFIYLLTDQTFYYVGKSNNPRSRLINHISGSLNPNIPTYNSDVGIWIRGLIDQGKKPEMIILEEVDYQDWEWAEREWIARYRQSKGHHYVLNMTSGGISYRGIRPTKKVKEKDLILYGLNHEYITKRTSYFREDTISHFLRQHLPMTRGEMYQLVILNYPDILRPKARVRQFIRYGLTQRYLYVIPERIK